QLAIELRNNLSRCGMEVASPRVVAEALPESQDVLLVGRRQIADRRKASDKAMEVRNDGSDLRLLKHRLADEHVIGIDAGIRRPLVFGPAPWEVAPVEVVPA